MTQSVVTTPVAAAWPGLTSGGKAMAHAAAFVLFLFVLLLSARPLEGQSRGEVQVTAQVLPLVPARQAALDFAIDPQVPQSNDLFRISRVARPQPVRAADPKREELIVVIEFLAN